MKAAQLAVLIVVVLAACRSAPPDAQPAQEHEHTAGEASEPEAADRAADHILRIAPEMVRDLRLTTTPAEARVSGEGVTALGELRVNEDAYAEVGSPIAARVVNVLAGVGDVVAPGQPVAQLRSVHVGKAIADYLRDRTRSQLASQVLQRKRALAADRIAPSREVQEAEAEAEAAAAELHAAEAGLKALGLTEDDVRAAGAGNAELVLRSPIAGTVIERNAVRGQLADPATLLFRVADVSMLWVIAHVFERDAVRVQVGTTARVTFPALPGRTFAGTVTLVGRQVDVGSRTIPVRIEIANDDGVLRPGMSATAWVSLGDTGGTIVAVPTAALQRCEHGWCVFIPRGAEAFEMRPVGRGRDLGGEIEVVNGLQAGETVVVDGAFLLKAEADRATGEGEHHDH